MSSSTQKSSCGSRIHNINSGAFFLPKGEEHDKESWRAERWRIPDQSPAFPSFISAGRARMCQWRVLVFKPYTQIWGSTFCKSCLLIFLCLLALEEPKWYSKPELSWHSNDLGIASPLYGPPDENQGQLHAQRFMHISLQDVCNFYKNIMIFRSRKKIFKEKAVSWRLSVSKILNEPPLDSEGTVCTSSLNPTLSLLHYLHLSGR